MSVKIRCLYCGIILLRGECKTCNNPNANEKDKNTIIKEVLTEDELNDYEVNEGPHWFREMIKRLTKQVHDLSGENRELKIMLDAKYEQEDRKADGNTFIADERLDKRRKRIRQRNAHQDKIKELEKENKELREKIKSHNCPTCGSDEYIKYSEYCRYCNNSGF